MLNIKVLGPGCPNCYRVEKRAVEALEKLAAEHPDLEATIQHVEDFNEIMAYPIMTTPGLVINEEVVCAGRIPKATEILEWMQEALHEHDGE